MHLGSLLSATGKIFAGGALSTWSCLRGGSLLFVLGPVDLASSVSVRDDMNLGRYKTLGKSLWLRNAAYDLVLHTWARRCLLKVQLSSVAICP